MESRAMRPRPPRLGSATLRHPRRALSKRTFPELAHLSLQDGAPRALPHTGPLMVPVSHAQADILRYLIAHLDARDTIEGIEKWWLPPDRQYGVADISA